jgi:hypothetical protein
MTWVRRAVVCLALLIGLATVARGADVVDPHVTTDRSVDTWSPQTMVASLVRQGMTDREKALAVYNYVRRTMFHYRYLTSYGGGGTMDLINGVGYCLCTPTAGTQARLCSLAGLKGRVLSTPGHGSVSVFYDGRWHWMDAFLGGCVWNKKRTAIASLSEINADPALLRREKPSPVPLFPCRDVLLADALRFEPDNKKYQTSCGPDDLAWAARAKPGERKPMVWKDRSSLEIILRPGESYVRSWGGEPGMYFLMKTPERFAPPHHFCGLECEKRDTVNWPYWKPYVREITSSDPKTGKKRSVKTGRYWANGRLTWRPELSAATLKQFARAENAEVDGDALKPVDGAKPLLLEWKVKCPYMLQGGWLSAGVSGELKASLRPKRRGKFRPLAPAAVKSGRLEAPLRKVLMTARGTREYVLRLELSGRDAALSDLELVTVFQHNMYALPQLMPGKNKVKVVAGNGGQLDKTRFYFECAWQGQGAGKTEKLRRRIARSPTELTVEIPGKDLPRMRYLLLENLGPETAKKHVR